jgi:methylenetetrahydrofolate reductase (NADPH)
VTQVSIELVPRSAESVRREVQIVCDRFPSVRTVNIPDLLRMPLRSWEACALAREALPRAIPHLRAMDFDAEASFELAGALASTGLDEVLVITGDPPQDMARRVYPTTPLELIPRIRDALPGARIYAAFDPYRSGVRQELEYAHAKLEAGAIGLFSQPFFDLRLMDVWADLLAGCELYWGISPVLTARTRRYWETKNRAVFPADFEPTLEWNRAFARNALTWARERDTNLYYMPIRTDLVEYLQGIVS